jgi:hypothetical protein
MEFEAIGKRQSQASFDNHSPSTHYSDQGFGMVQSGTDTYGY